LVAVSRPDGTTLPHSFFHFRLNQEALIGRSRSFRSLMAAATEQT